MLIFPIHAPLSYLTVVRDTLSLVLYCFIVIYLPQQKETSSLTLIITNKKTVLYRFVD